MNKMCVLARVRMCVRVRVCMCVCECVCICDWVCACMRVVFLYFKQILFNSMGYRQTYSNNHYCDNNNNAPKSFFTFCKEHFKLWLSVRLKLGTKKTENVE